MISWLVVALLLLNVGDLVTTWLCLQQNGLGEANPLARWGFRVVGFWPCMVVKMLVISAVAVVLAVRADTIARSYWTLCGLLLPYGWVVVHNYRHYRATTMLTGLSDRSHRA
jgi:hypothetical protein